VTDRERIATTTPPTPATKLIAPALRPEIIPRARVLWELQTATKRPLTVIVAPAGYGKTTAIVQWLEHADVEHAWLTLDTHDNDPQWFAGRLLAALDRALPGRFDGAQRALQAGSDLRVTVVPLVINALAERAGEPFAIAVDDFHLISDAACHELATELIDLLPRDVSVVIASRTMPPLRLGRRRTASVLAELGPEDLRFDREESERLLNATLGLALDRAHIEQIDDRVDGWPAGVALIATAIEARGDGTRVLDAIAASRDDLEVYLIEEVVEAARPEMRDFLRRTSILTCLNAPLCEAVLGDPRARVLLDEVRHENLFVTAVDAEGEWLRYHHMFAEALAAELQRREPHLVGELHLRAAEWFVRAGMFDEAIEHALLSGDGPRAAALLAANWLALASERRYTTIRRVLDRLPEDRGEFGPLCEALELVCMTYEGVDQRYTCERAMALAERHGDDPQVRLVVDDLLISPFYGDIGRAVEIGREAWERYASDPQVQLRLASSLAMVLWFAGEYQEVRQLLEPRLHVDQPLVTKVFTLATLAMTAADEGDDELAERYAREAMGDVEAARAETALEFTGLPWVLAETLRRRGKLDEARHHLSRGLEAEERRPGSVGHALALTYDAQLALSERDRPRALRSASRAREIIDSYPDLGTLDTRLARIEVELGEASDTALLGTEPTPSEIRVLELLATNKTLAEIAAELYLSRHTVRSHQRRLYRRLGEATREAAVAAALERGLLDGR
jgi:DNA-binding CsgD family transcriptional regulator